MHFLTNLFPTTYRLAVVALVAVAVFVASSTTGSDMPVQAGASQDLATIGQSEPADRPNASDPLRIVSVAFSDPNSDHIWRGGTNLDITVTLNQEVTVGTGSEVNTGSFVGTTSQALGDEFHCQSGSFRTNYAYYHSGNGTNQLVFRCRLIGPSRTRVFIQENSMHLTNPSVRYLNFHPRYVRTSDTHGLAGPTVTSISTNTPPSNGLWAGGDRVDVNATFSEPVKVGTRNNNPYIIVIEKTPNGSQAHHYRYRAGSGTNTLRFSRTLRSTDNPVHSIVLVANRFIHGDGYIVANANKAVADLSHAGGTIGGVFTRGVSSKAAFLPGKKRHDGKSSFTRDIVFNGEPQNLTPQDDASTAIKVTNGVLNQAQYINDDDRTAWKVSITPNGGNDVTITMPSGSCADEGIVCIDGEPLETDISTTVKGPLTGSFTSVPTAHNGASPFAVHLDFDRAPAAGFSYKTVEDGLLTINGGSIERVWRRQGGNDQLWGIQVRPGSTSDVTISLRQTTDCSAEHAVCDSEGRMLAAGSPLTIQGPPPVSDSTTDTTEQQQVTGSISNAPTSHSGSGSFTFHLQFSETPKSNFSYTTLAEHAFTVTNGTIKKARRLEPPGNVKWEVTVAPSNTGEVTVTLPSTTNCAASGAICTNDGRKFTGPLTLSVPGP